MNCSVIFNSHHAHTFPHLYIFILKSSYSQNHVVRHSNLQHRFSLKVGLHNKNRGLKQTHKKQQLNCINFQVIAKTQNDIIRRTFSTLRLTKVLSQSLSYVHYHSFYYHSYCVLRIMTFSVRVGIS